MNWVAIRKALFEWVVACTGFDTQKVMWARQLDAPRPLRDGLILKLYVVDNEGRSWIDVVDNPLTFADKSIASVTGNTLTSPNHGLLTGDGPVHFVGADLPAPLAEDTNYWIIKVDANSFRVASTFVATGGLDGSGNPVTPITLTDAGSGSMTVVATSKTLRSGQEIEFVQRGMVRATLQVFSYVSDDTGLNGAIATLRRIPSRYLLPSNYSILDEANIAVTGFERTRSMLGSRDATLFEPRAWIDVDLSLVSEERESGGIIGRVEVSREDPLPYTETIENEDL